jgi:putative NIF3 family GTP cyclohydrolase 1 type 2
MAQRDAIVRYLDETLEADQYRDHLPLGLQVPGAPDPVQRIGIISGAAAREIGAAADLGLDCFITGEPEEDSPYLAAELGVTLIAAGHNATETVGVRAVGDRLAEVFGVTTTFIGVENPV